jgi:hypothetical protein
MYHQRIELRGTILGPIPRSWCSENPGERIVGTHGVPEDAKCSRCWGWDPDAAIDEAERILRER